MKKKHLLLILLMVLLAPWAAKAQSLCDPEDQCEITYALVDSYGDGWNGGKITVTDVTASTQLATWTISSGYSANGSLAVCIGHEIQFSYTTGSYAYENSWTIYDVTGATIWEGSGSDGAQSETYTVVCPSCYPPTAFHAILTPGDGTIATLSWTKGNDESNWELQYSTNSTFASEVTTYDGSFTVEGTTVSADLMILTPETTYYARVKADCGGSDESAWSSVLSFQPTNAFTIGNGSVESVYAPLVTNYKKSYDQMIYTADQLDFAGPQVINKIGFNSKTANTKERTITVYMGHTTKSSFSSSTDFVSINDLTPVYTNTWNIAAGWNEFTLTEPFEYDGTSNLIVAMYSTASSYNSTSFYCTETTNNQVVYAYDDNYDPNPNTFEGNWNSYSGTKSNSKNLPNLRLFASPNTTPKPTIVSAVSNTPVTAIVTWAAPTTGAPTGYTYQHKLSTDGEWGDETTVGSGVLTANLDGLTPESDYDFRIKALYGAESSSYATTSFTTVAACMTPENLTITNVTWNSATFNWTEGYGAGQWRLGYKTGSDPYTYVDVELAQLPITLNGEFVEQTTYDVVVYPLCNETKTLEGSFTTKCEPITAVSWGDDFESYSAGDFNSGCWVNEHISGSGTQIFMIYTSANGTNSTKQLQLPDMYSGTMTKLVLPGFQIPAGKNYLFGLDVYRNSSTSDYGEGIRVFASTDGEIEGATELAFISRSYTTTDGNLIPAEAASGWYSYELPIGFDGLCYIILRGESKYGSNTFMDNFTIEEILPCDRPSAVTKSNVTNHSAKLSWTAGDPSQDAWQIAYKAGANFDPTDNEALATATVIPVTTNPYTFDKTLDPATTYYMYVRANCGGDGYSKWSKTVCSFTTESAAPAPTTFAKTEVGPNWVDLYWNAPAGDYLSGYGIYYSTISTEPTEETAAIVTINNPTAPTSEAPYRLTGLENETKYYIWVRANHEASVYSAWKAITGTYFTTLVACPAPTALAAKNITHTTADLTWTGYSDSYTVEYQTSAYQQTVFFDDFENGIGDWTVVTEGEGPGWALSTDYSHSTSHSMTTYSYDFTNWSSYDADNWLISPQITMGKTLKFWAYQRYSDEYEVLFSTSNSISSFNTELQAMATVSPSQTWVEFTIDLTTAGIEGQTGYIAIHHVYEDGGYLAIDDFGIYGDEVPAGGWEVATTTATGGAYTIEGLTADTKYDVHVKGNCGGEYSDVKTFTTIDNNTKIFKTAGDWNVAGNWEGGIPENMTQNAIIRANVTIPNGCVATAKNITFEGTPTPTITMMDGGQLMHNNTGVTLTVHKSITGYGDGDGKWYLLSVPSSPDVDPDDVENMITGDYDLYRFDYEEVGEEWQNYKIHNYDLPSGWGYLYANKADKDLIFTNEIDPIGGEVWTVPITNTESGTQPLNGFHLIGNFYPCNTYLTIDNVASAFYKMNNAGNEIITAVAGTTIAPCEGIFVLATSSTEQKARFVKELPVTSSNNGNIVVSVSNNATRGTIIDNTIVCFGEGEGLDKFQLNPNHTKLYIPQEGKDYAVVYTEAKGEMPLNFKAETTAKYTISISSEDIEFSYLRLIDNFTGANVDLLIDPEYTFIGSPRDDENRFRIVFSTNNAENENDVFVYQNDSELIVNGEGELQVYDVMGRFVTSMKINGSERISADNFSDAMYIFRLVGSDVKTQKIVVR